MSPTGTKQKKHPPELRRTKSQGIRKVQKTQSVASMEMDANGGGGGALTKHMLYVVVKLLI